MIKKLLIAFLLLSGLIIGVSLAIAQTAPTNATPTQPAVLQPLISSDDIDSKDIPEKNLRQGMRNPHVRKIQEILRSLGHFPTGVTTTENFGPLTREAIRRFQQEKGIPATGFFGTTTRSVLRGQFKKDRVVIDQNVNIVCMRTAVEKRENAIITAHDTFANRLKTIHETRRTDLLAAWSVQDPRERHTAVKNAWEKYRESKKTIRKEENQSRRTIWSQFNQEAKNCRAIAAETKDLEDVEDDENDDD